MRHLFKWLMAMGGMASMFLSNGPFHLKPLKLQDVPGTKMSYRNHSSVGSQSFKGTKSRKSPRRTGMRHK